MKVPGRSLTTLAIGLVVGTLIGAQMHGAVAGSPPCKPGKVVAHATPTPWLTTKQAATPTFDATAPPGKQLLALSGTTSVIAKTDSAIFNVVGPFSVHYTSQMLDTVPPESSAFFGILLYANDNKVFDLLLDGVTFGGKPTPNGTSLIRSDDCSHGCYLEVDASNLRYSITVTE